MTAFDEKKFALEWGLEKDPSPSIGRSDGEIPLDLDLDFEEMDFEIDEEDMQAVANDHLDDEFYGETYLYYLQRPDRSSIPPYLMGEKQPHDELILKRLGQAKTISWLSDFNYDVDKLFNHQVAFTLASNRSFSWNRILESSPGTGAIQVAVTFIYLLYRKESLFRMARQCSRGPQLNELWEGIAHLGGKGASCLEACKLITQLVMDKQKYSLVIEEDASEILSHYRQRVECAPFRFRRYMNAASTPESTSGIPVNDKDKKMFEIIHTVMKDMKSIPVPLEDENYTRVLIGLLRGRHSDEKDWLIGEAMKVMPNTELKEEHKLDLYYFLGDFMNDFTMDLKFQLLTVMMPFCCLYGESDTEMDSEIFEIIQVAELRRMALGSRFIGRSHLIWAYYECGFVVHSGFREGINLMSFTNEDHPPYHIYLTATKIANYIGMKCMTLECFVYAIIFSEDVSGFDDEKMEKNMLKHYKNFESGVFLCPSSS